jgi:hypothetical protein
MNILFWKLLAHKELKEEAEYILNSRDIEYSLTNQLRVCNYNPIEKLKELEADLDSQLMTPEIKDLIQNKTISSVDELIKYLTELDKLIGERFKYYGIFITKQIYEYLSKKEINV